MGHLGREIIITDRAGIAVDTQNGVGVNRSLSIVEGKRNYFYVTYDFDTLGLDAARILISLDNASGKWGHPTGGTGLHIQDIHIHSNQPPDGLGILMVGFLTRLGASDSDILILGDWPRTIVSPFHFVDTIETSLGGGFRSATTFGPTATTSLITSGGTLVGPDGANYAPKVGDLVVYYDALVKNAEMCMFITYDVLGLS